MHSPLEYVMNAEELLQETVVVKLKLVPFQFLSLK